MLLKLDVYWNVDFVRKLIREIGEIIKLTCLKIVIEQIKIVVK